jgi:DNA-directed RNA polymerase specialized sigma24 family protein
VDDFVAFYDRHERAVVAFVGGRVRDPELTVDIVAETFARVPGAVPARPR